MDWIAEAALDPAISAAGLPPARTADSETILLTGATGFLGAFLLDDLLRQTSVTVVCLARADSDAAAGERIRANLRQYGLNSGERMERLVPLAGDLAQPRFGLADHDWARLGADVDSVIHNGAYVHFLHPYSVFRPANVAGTQEVLRLATTARLKPVHFISSLAVFAGAGHGQPAAESDRDESPAGLENGYAQSKWVAEQLVWQAMDRGVPATVLRPGRVGWHSRTGALGADDLLARAIRACVRLGAAPTLDTPLELSPVDYVSRAVVEIARRPESLGRAYHLGNRRAIRLGQLLDMVRTAGYALQPLPPEEWLRQVQGAATHDAEDALTALLPLLSARPRMLTNDPAAPNLGATVDDRITRAALAGTGVECPPVTAESVAAFLARLAAAGLLAAPVHGKPRTNGRSHTNGQPAHSRPRTQGTK